MSIAETPDATPEPDVTDVLNGAANYIATHGLHKGEFFNEPGAEVCTLGAIALIVTTPGGFCDPDTVVDEPAAVAFLEYLDQAVPGLIMTRTYSHSPNAGIENGEADSVVDLVQTVGGWNDAPERTAEQVIDTLRSAARWAGAR